MRILICYRKRWLHWMTIIVILGFEIGISDRSWKLDVGSRWFVVVCVKGGGMRVRVRYKEHLFPRSRRSFITMMKGGLWGGRSSPPPLAGTSYYIINLLHSGPHDRAALLELFYILRLRLRSVRPQKALHTVQRGAPTSPGGNQQPPSTSSASPFQ